MTCRLFRTARVVAPAMCSSAAAALPRMSSPPWARWAISLFVVQWYAGAPIDISLVYLDFVVSPISIFSDLCIGVVILHTIYWLAALTIPFEQKT